MNDWNADQHVKFEDDRTRATRDLPAQVSGFDSSEDMLAQARKRLPGCEFFLGDAAVWTPSEPTDLLFANAVFQ